MPAALAVDKEGGDGRWRATASVTDMSGMLHVAAVFNGDVSAWKINTASVTDVRVVSFGAAA